MKSLAIVLIVFVQIIWGINDIMRDHVINSSKVYEHWKPKFRKQYSNEVDEARAANTIQNEFIKIKEFNMKFEQGSVSFRRKLWKYSDVDYSIRKKLHSGFRYTFNTPKKMNSELSRRQKRGTIINYLKGPKSFDWRTHNVLSPIQDQGFICSSCFAFTTTGAIEAQIAILNKKHVKLSEQQIIDCNFNETEGNWGCDGGWMAPAFDYVINNPGLVTEVSYPYEAVTNVCRFNSSNVAAKISSYVILPNDEEILKNALSSVGPIATAIDATLDSFFTYSDGVYFDKACSQNLTHAVLLVGYDTDPEYGDFWICKNSWSTSWGEDGYFKIKRNVGNHCGIGNYAVYPVL